MQRVCDPRFYDGKHGEVGRSREALWREIVHTEFGVMEGEMRHDDMEGRLCDFDNYSDMDHHIYHFCSEVTTNPAVAAVRDTTCAISIVLLCAAYTPWRLDGA